MSVDPVKLEQRIQDLEDRPVFMSTIDPQSDSVFEQRIAIPYTTTVPSFIPRVNGVRRIYFDGTRYWLYLYANGGWRSTLMGGTALSGRAFQAVCFDFTTSVSTGDGKFYFHIDTRVNGMNLVDVHALVITAGTTGTTDIQIANVTDAVDMLTTKITIDSSETGSDTAATPAVIDTTKDDVATNDILRIDVDAVSTTAPKGLIVTLGFNYP